MKNLIKTVKDNLKINVDKVDYYDGGISNDNFLVNDKYMYRRKKEFHQPFYYPKCEKEIEEFLKDKNITVPLICIFEDGTKITEFLKDSTNISDIKLTDEILIKIALKIKELHSYKYKACEDFKPITRLYYYLESNKNPHRNLNNFIINNIKKYYDNCELIMCHNDLVPGNILLDKDHNIKIIDFEYASNNHPFFDVISFLSENNITDKRQIDLFIKTYYGEENIPSNIEQMIEDFYNFLDLLWYNWSVMMYYHLHEPIYYQICKIKASRLKQIKY